MANLDLSNSFLTENDERVLREYWGILLNEGYLDRGDNVLTKYQNGVQSQVIVSKNGRMEMSSYKIMVDGKYPSYCSFQTYYFADVVSGNHFKAYAEDMLQKSEMLTFRYIAFRQASNIIHSILINNKYAFVEIDDKGVVKYNKIGNDNYTYEFNINHGDQKMSLNRIGTESLQKNTCDFDDINELSPDEIFIKLSSFEIRS